MDLTLYKYITVSRGLQYHYFCSPADAGKPTLMFLHGFPSNSRDWHLQVDYMRHRGYGIIAPDMLGSGQTSRPLNPEAYRLNMVAADMIDIINNENLDSVIGIGHDWGCVVLSHLSVLYASRFQAFAWIGLSFMEPVTVKFDLDAIMLTMKDLLGYEGYAYWKFFIREDADAIIEDNVDSFLQLLYPKDPDLWLTFMALPGKTAEWMERKMTPGFPHYLTSEDITNLQRNILEGGIRSALSWYISQVNNLDLDDNLRIPREQWTIRQPSFFAVALKDCICTPNRGKASMEKFGTNVTTVEFETGHWPHLEASTKLNHEFDAWLETLL